MKPKYNVLGQDYQVSQIIENAEEYIRSGIEKFASKGQLIKEEPGTILERLHLEVNLQNAVKNADFIIEAIPEIMTLKKDLFGKLDNLAPKHCILASNTSSLSLTEIGEGVERID
ncbi:MAG: 3-hydroxyacyl-CoA dehydrogenase NAD-binding domain-containing protein [Candidatus Lokiarchaeota archaeon]